MTDEMTIQQRKSPVMPTVIGAGVGALGGLGVSAAYNRITDAKSYEELVAEVKDKTDFSSKKEPAKWSDLKKKTEEIVKLEKELKELPEKVLEESDPAAKARKSAQEAYDKELKRMIEAKEKSLGVDTTTNSIVKNYEAQKKILGDLSGNERNLIESELKAYENALQKLQGKPGSGHPLEAQHKNFIAARTKAENLLSGTKGYKVSNYVDEILPEKIKNIKSTFGTSGKKSLANYEQLASEFGEDVFKIHDTKNFSPKFGNDVIKIDNAYGSGKHAYVEVDKSALKEARKTLRTTYSENITRYKELNKELNSIKREFFDANKEALKEHGVTKVNDLDSFGTKDAAKFNKNLKQLEKNIEYTKGNGFTYVSDPFGKKSFMTVDDAYKYLDEMTEKSTLMKNYGEKRATALAEQNKLIAESHGVKQAKTKYQQALSENSGLKDAIKKIETKLTGKRAPEGGPELWAKLEPMLKAEGGSVSHSVDEAKLKEILDNNKYGKDLKAAIEKYEKALSEKGVANTAAREAKQGALNKVKGEAQKIAEGLAGKKMGAGMAAAIGAGIVGVATLLAVNSKNKNA